MKNTITRRNFLVSSTALAALGDCATADTGTAAPQAGGSISSESGIRVRFLGSGAAGWKPEWAQRPHMRRQSSVLIENRVLIDFTMCSFDMLPADCRP